jgi:hypothetical protein
MTWLLGLTVMVKSLNCAETDVCASTILSAPTAITVPPLNDIELVEVLFAGALGVRVMVTVAVDPDCRVIGPQLMLEFVPPAPQVPVLMVALTLLMGTPVWLKLARITMLVAKSGPLLVIV